MCAATVDRAAVLLAARHAMEAIGVDSAHELLGVPTITLGLRENSPAWDVAGKALMAADAWTSLTRDEQFALTSCVLKFKSVADVVNSWR